MSKDEQLPQCFTATPSGKPYSCTWPNCSCNLRKQDLEELLERLQAELAELEDARKIVARGAQRMTTDLAETVEKLAEARAEKERLRKALEEAEQLARDFAERTTDARQTICANSIADKISLLGKED